MEDKEFLEEQEEILDINPEKQTFIYKCENCGSNMVFDPETQMLKCPHCSSVVDFSKSSSVREIEIENAFNSAPEWKDGSSVYACENCGAVVVLDENEVATICPYCETSHIVKSEEIAGIMPNAVYPFTISLKEAIEKSRTFAKKRVFAPKAFKKTLKEESMQSVYEPCFTYDSQTFSTYVGRVGVHKTRTVGSGKNKRTQTYIVWRTISGRISLGFNDVFVNATSSYNQDVLDKLLPYNFSTIKTYQKQYLSGYMARRNETSVMDGFTVAKSKMDNKIRNEILSNHYHTIVDYLNVSTMHQNVTYKYALVPTYFMNYKFNKKLYKLYVNGNTGRVTGKTPISPLKVLFAALGGVAIVAGVAIALLLSGVFN